MRSILLDIEGTTSSVSFVYDVLFPYARAHLEAYLLEHWGTGELARVREQIARDAGRRSFQEWAAGGTGLHHGGGTGLLPDSPEAVREKLRQHVLELMDQDSKSTGLKALQGLIYARGYAQGALRSHVYPDVPLAMKRWVAAGKTVFIFSSGSVASQKLFFAHTEAGDLLPHLSGHFDTTTGPKREPESYRSIARLMSQAPNEVLFVSDVVAELDAAKAAGMETALSIRPGNALVTAAHGHREVRDFDGL